MGYITSVDECDVLDETSIMSTLYNIHDYFSTTSIDDVHKLSMDFFE